MYHDDVRTRVNQYEGIVPRLIEDMLALQTDGRRGDEVYAMSCMEIKDNRVFDLLNDDDNVSMAKPRRSCLAKASIKYSYLDQTSENLNTNSLQQLCTICKIL